MVTSKRQLEKIREWQTKNIIKVKAYKLKSQAKSRHGLAREDHLTLRHLPCYICGDVRGNQGLNYVDHCHTTNTIRGILCRSCNAAEGYTKHLPIGCCELFDFYREHGDFRVKGLGKWAM